MPPVFALHLPELDRTLRVARFRGTEAISRIPRFSLIVRLFRHEEDVLRTILGARAVFALAGAGLALAGGLRAAAGSIELGSSGASLVLDANASLDGALVRLNCGASAAGVGDIAVDAQIKRELRLKLLGADQLPIASKKYELVAPGLTAKGATTSDGLVVEMVPDGTSQVLLKVWHRDDDLPQQWSITIDEMASVETIEGVAQRLRNLGYLVGPIPSELTTHLRAAIWAFQAAAGIPSTGELDDDTRAALLQIHP